MGRINPFYIVAAVSSLLLTVYGWFMFLPMFEGMLEYNFVRDAVSVLTVLLIAAAGIQVYLSIEKEKLQENELTDELVKE